MGIGIGMSSSRYDTPVERVVEKVVIKNLPNPNPYNYLIVLINYPDCKNYEGNKVLLYKDIKIKDLKKQDSIDPHFSNNKLKHSPIARFVPTISGWQMALKLVDTLIKSDE